MARTCIAELEFPPYAEKTSAAACLFDRERPKQRQKVNYGTVVKIEGGLAHNFGDVLTKEWDNPLHISRKSIATAEYARDLSADDQTFGSGKKDPVTTVSCTPDISELTERSAEFLEAVYQLDRTNQHRRAVDVILDHVDDLLIHSESSVAALVECDYVLTTADVARLSDSSIVSFLGITIGAKGILKRRRGFFLRSLQRLSESRGPEGAGRLLFKYE